MSREKWSPILDAIADGVELRLQLDMGISDIAIGENSRLAHRLDIPEKDIRRWAVKRGSQRGKIIKNIESLLHILRNNAIAQRVLCNFTPFGSFKKLSGYDNWKMN